MKQFSRDSSEVGVALKRFNIDCFSREKADAENMGRNVRVTESSLPLLAQFSCLLCALCPLSACFGLFYAMCMCVVRVRVCVFVSAYKFGRESF